MPHYFLHLRDGSQLFEDPEGRMFDDLAGAEREATKPTSPQKTFSRPPTTTQGLKVSPAVSLAMTAAHRAPMMVAAAGWLRSAR
jgi:hypothetical protein